MPNTLLSIKLYPPPLRAGLIRRARLLEKLDLGLAQGRQITLVSAPAGYGKTTLVREWLNHLDRPFAWLALDRGDNYPVQFLAYLSAALKGINEQIGSSLRRVLPDTDWLDNQPAWLDAELQILLNEIAAVPYPFVLVFDDYQSISEIAVHQVVGYLLDHLPPNLHLIITTRQDPMLRLSAFRGRGLLNEIRLGDLRFTESEVNAFLNETLCLALDPHQVAQLTGRTEGWIAGLHLAGISLAEAHGQDPDAANRTRAEFIEAFTGDDRYVMDYLMDEVLSREPEEVQRFLLNTSMLKQMCGSLCDALLEGELSQAGQAVLERLERSNLFIIPLDNRRQWYRYHHLFGDLLHSRLQSTDPSRLAGLHRRASQWYAEVGMTAEAVDHALLSEDFDHAVRLIERAARRSIWSSGELPVLFHWSRRLPDGALMSRPRLLLYYARALFFDGQVETALEYLKSAERALRERAADDPGDRELWAVLYTNQATFSAMQGLAQTALQCAEQAELLLLPEDLSTRARVGHAVGMAEFMLGHVEDAATAFTGALRLAVDATNRNLGLDLAACQALATIEAGRLREASQICEEALASFHQGAAAPPASAVYLALASVAWERSDLPAALAYLDRAAELGSRAGWPHITWQVYALLARVRQASGDPTGALAAAGRAEDVTRRYGLEWAATRVASHRVRLALHQGDLRRADEWAAARAAGSAAVDSRHPVEMSNEFEDLTMARVHLAHTRPAEALALLDPMLPCAEADHRGRCQLEITILRALALAAQNQDTLACESLAHALKLAAPEGWLRLFLDEGRPLADLLLTIRPDHFSGTGANDLAFLTHLIAAFDGEAADQSSFPASTAASASLELVQRTAGKSAARLPGNTALVEPLSERELEVLRLVACGLTNPEIAARLYLSVNTLRAHTTHIFRKLDVHNRVQAVERARQLGLLENA